MTTYWSESTLMIRWTGLAPWEAEFSFPGNLTSTFLGDVSMKRDLLLELQGYLVHKKPPPPPRTSTRPQA